jgi:hypothetical protein
MRITNCAVTFALRILPASQSDSRTLSTTHKHLLTNRVLGGLLTSKNRGVLRCVNQQKTMIQIDRGAQINMCKKPSNQSIASRRLELCGPKLTLLKEKVHLVLFSNKTAPRHISVYRFALLRMPGFQISGLQDVDQ